MLVINHEFVHEQRGIDEVIHASTRDMTQQMAQEEDMISKLQQTTTQNLPVPDHISTRRKSSGDIFRALGDHCKAGGEMSRRSTFEAQPAPPSRPTLVLKNLTRSSLMRDKS